MFLKFCRMECVPLKLEPHIIPVLRFGKGRNMVKNAIFGQRDAYSMSYAHYIPLLELKIFLVYTKKLLWEIMTLYLQTILKNFSNSSVCA